MSDKLNLFLSFINLKDLRLIQKRCIRKNINHTTNTKHLFIVCYDLNEDELEIHELGHENLSSLAEISIIKRKNTPSLRYWNEGY